MLLYKIDMYFFNVYQEHFNFTMSMIWIVFLVPKIFVWKYWPFLGIKRWHLIKNIKYCLNELFYELLKF